MIKELFSYVMTVGPNTALVIANALLVLVTIGLVIVTWRYTSHTKKMADVMMKDYELRVTPIVEVIVMSKSAGPPGCDCRWEVHVKNRGDNNVYLRDLKCALVAPDGNKTTVIEDKHFWRITPHDYHPFYLDVKYPEQMIEGSKYLFAVKYSGIDHKFKTWELELP